MSRELKKYGVNAFLNQEVSAQMVQDTKPGAIVVTTGAEPTVPEEIPGIDTKNVVQAIDILTGKVGESKAGFGSLWAENFILSVRIT